MSRPSWEDYFGSLLVLIRERSHDEHTKCSCIITENNVILGTGYNGFPCEIDTSDLPLTRPEKYPWMIHAEQNAIYNCSRKPINGVAYMATVPCITCAQALWQFGIRKFVIYNINHPTMCKEEEYIKNISKFYELTKGKLKVVYYNLSEQWIENALHRFKESKQDLRIT